MHPFHMDVQVLDDELEIIDKISVGTQDVVQKTCQLLWMIETYGERE